jgi:hypothetical protein
MRISPTFCVGPPTLIYLRFNRKAFPMFYVICPTCRARVEIPIEAIGPDRSDLYNITHCDDCGTGFDYDDEDVENDDDGCSMMVELP